MSAYQCEDISRILQALRKGVIRAIPNPSRMLFEAFMVDENIARRYVFGDDIERIMYALRSSYRDIGPGSNVMPVKYYTICEGKEYGCGYAFVDDEASAIVDEIPVIREVSETRGWWHTLPFRLMTNRQATENATNAAVEQ